jgi:hypothetical protein
MSLLKLWYIRNLVLVSYSICMRQGSSNLSGSQSALACLCVCARARLGLREFNSYVEGALSHSLLSTASWVTMDRPMRSALSSFPIPIPIPMITPPPIDCGVPSDLHTHRSHAILLWFDLHILHIMNWIFHSLFSMLTFTLLVNVGGACRWNILDPKDTGSDRAGPACVSHFAQRHSAWPQPWFTLGSCSSALVLASLCNAVSVATLHLVLHVTLFLLRLTFSFQHPS